MRIKISKENDELLYKLKTLYNFKNDGIVPRIAFSNSLLSGKIFDIENDIIPSSDGKEFRDDKAIFGTVIGNGSNTIIFKSILDQHYGRITFEDEFIKLFKLHLNHGLEIWNSKIENANHYAARNVLPVAPVALPRGLPTVVKFPEIMLQYCTR